MEGTLTRENASMEDTLTRENVSIEGTLTRDNVSMEDRLTSEIYSNNSKKYIRIQNHCQQISLVFKISFNKYGKCLPRRGIFHTKVQKPGILCEFKEVPSVTRKKNLNGGKKNKKIRSRKVNLLKQYFLTKAVNIEEV